MINTGLIHVIATGLMTTAYHEWKRFHNGNKTWSYFKEHFNEAFNELNKITIGSIGFGANAMEFTPTTIEEISGTLDNLANATMQKTDIVNKLVAAS